MIEKKLCERMSAFGITLTDEMQRQFDRYFELLVEWNKVMNLTGITDYDEVNEKHFLDSLAVVRVLDLSDGPGD